MGILFAFDFDLTITSQQTHNIIYKNRLDRADKDEQWKVVQPIEPRGEAQQWRILFQDLIDNGHQITIISYNNFPDIVGRYLRDKIGLSEDVLNKIYINCWMPDDMEFGKNIHIQQSLKHFGSKLSNSKVVLVEDSKYNLQMANKANLLIKNGSILAPITEADICPNNPNIVNSAPHIKQVMELSLSLKQLTISENKSAFFSRPYESKDHHAQTQHKPRCIIL